MMNSQNINLGYRFGKDSLLLYKSKSILLWFLPLNRKLELYEQIDDEDIEVDGYL